MDKKVTIETRRGVGNVMKEGKPIARVLYLLRVTQLMISDGRGGYMPGLKDVGGRINVVAGDTNLNDGSLLQLQMTDGRVWPFYARPSNPLEGNFPCVSAGEFHFQLDISDRKHEKIPDELK